MRYLECVQFLALAACLSCIAGCGSASEGPAKPAADLDEIQQYLADNPDQDVDGLQDDGDESDDLAE